MRELFYVEQVIRCNDTVLGLKLTCVKSNESLVIICVYLPPESSKYGGDNNEIFNKLTIESYFHVDADYVIICGDFNARIGRLDDCLLNSEIPIRHIVDEELNSQGKRFVNFISDIKGCVLNGRVTPELNDVTSITAHKGKAVVNYIIMRQSEFDAIKSMEVRGCNELIDEFKLHSMLGPKCKTPDHSMLIAKLELSMTVHESLYDVNLGSINVK